MLTRSFDRLTASLDAAFRAVDGLRRGAEDVPPHEDLALTRILSARADDLHGWLAEALAAVERCRRVLPADLAQARVDLGEASEAVLRALDELDGTLTFERRLDVHRLRRRTGPWRDWADGVHDAGAEADEGLRRVLVALLDAWQELAERSGAGAVSVSTTSVGQQFLDARPDDVLPGAR